MPVDKRYLWKRGGTYSAVFDVPKAVQAALGTKRFVKALGTSSLSEANRLKLPLVMEWKRRVAQAQKAGDDPLAKVWSAALEFNSALATSETFIDREREASGSGELLDVVREQAAAVLEEHGRETADRFFSAATGTATFSGLQQRAQLTPKLDVHRNAARIIVLGLPQPDPSPIVANVDLVRRQREELGRTHRARC